MHVAATARCLPLDAIPREHEHAASLLVFVTSIPHDALFKAIFEQPQHAAAELRHILPKHVANAIEWPSLALEPGSYVDAKLRERHSDLLFSADAVGGRVLVYLLFEHQSSNDRTMPLRLLEYMLRIWARHGAERPNDPLPVIVPAVLAQVPGGWASPTRFRELFAPDLGALAGSIPDFAYAVDDLAAADNDELRARPHPDPAKLALWLMRDIRDVAALLEALSQWADVLERLAHTPNGVRVLRLLLHYVAHGAKDLQLSVFRAKLRTSAPVTESVVMSTIAEQLHAEGRARGKLEGKAEGKLEGKAEGKLEGKAEGKVEGKAESLLLILHARGLGLGRETEERIRSCRDLETLERWLRRAAVESSVDAIVAD